jgi:hypothetical protein
MGVAGLAPCDGCTRWPQRSHWYGAPTSAQHRAPCGPRLIVRRRDVRGGSSLSAGGREENTLDSVVMLWNNRALNDVNHLYFWCALPPPPSVQAKWPGQPCLSVCLSVCLSANKMAWAAKSLRCESLAILPACLPVRGAPLVRLTCAGRWWAPICLG